LKGYAIAAIIVLILLPYGIISFYVLTAPVSNAAFFVNATTRANCAQYASSSRNLKVSSQGSADYSTISAAVLAARPGDVVVVQRGIYHEAIYITTPCLTITGIDRKGVILDGERKLADGVWVSKAAGVTISSLTVKNYGNGIYYEEASDWTIRRVDSVNNGAYGIYTVASKYGTMANDFTMGNGDSGFYIGEVFDCSCSILNSTAYGNVLGYSGTRANGVTIRDSRFINNSVGIGPNTLLPELSVLLRGNWRLPLVASNHTIVNNVIQNNNNATVKGVGISQSYGVPIGTGISMLGVSQSTIANNKISGNKLWGILEVTFLNVPIGNTYSSNIFSRNGQDFFTDGTGFFGCSANETASGSILPSCGETSWLRLTIPNPINELILIENVGRPGLANNQVVAILFIPFLAVGTGLATTRSPSRMRRLGSAVVDLLVAGDIYIVITSILVITAFGAYSPADVAYFVESISLLFSPLAYFLIVTMWVGYGIVLEGLRRQTLGQRLLTLRMTDRRGERASLPRILVKNVFLYVDTLFFGIIGLISIAAKGKTLGELVSGAQLRESVNSK